MMPSSMNEGHHAPTHHRLELQASPSRADERTLKPEPLNPDSAMFPTDLPTERIQRIEIDDKSCAMIRACCPGGCGGMGAPSVFVHTDEGVPAIRLREDWVENELMDALLACPTEAISVVYETFRLTADGPVPLDEQDEH